MLLSVILTSHAHIHLICCYFTQLELTGEGDTHLGGEDFDQRLMAHCLQKFKTQHKKDFSADQKAMARLRKQCETAKRTLSTQTSAQIEVIIFIILIKTCSFLNGSVLYYKIA